MNMKRICIILILLSMTISVNAQDIITNPIKTVWDANSESYLAGYRVYISNETGKAYTLKAEVSTNEYIIDLPNGIYFMVVTAYSDDGIESDPSNEVSFRIKSMAPPTGLKCMRVE